MLELSVSGINSECRVSVDKSGRVSDIAAAVYKQLWKDLSEDQFEARWTTTRMVLSRNDSIIPDDIPIVDALAMDDKAQCSVIELGFILQVASDEEQVRRRRLSRIRQSQTGNRTKLVPMDKDLSRVPFKRDLIARVAHALEQGRQVSGHHEITCRKGALSWAEQDYSWTLLYQHNIFVWRHQRRGQDSTEQDSFPSQEEFIDFWTQLSERSACIYSGLLLYKDSQEATRLEGTPLIADFVRFVSNT